MKGRSSGFIWDPTKYFAIHYFSTCIIIEGFHEEKHVHCGHSEWKWPFLDCCREPGWTSEMHQTSCMCAGAGMPDSVLHKSTSNVYLFLPISHHTCTSTATSLLICNMCIPVCCKWIKRSDLSWLCLLNVASTSTWWNGCESFQSELISSSHQLAVCIFWRIRYVLLLKEFSLEIAHCANKCTFIHTVDRQKCRWGV